MSRIRTIRFLLDENVHGVILRAIRRHNRTMQPIDATRVDEADGPPCGTRDSELLEWSIANDRILISNDANTLIELFTERVAAGQTLPGLLLLKRRMSIVEFIETLEMLAACSMPSDTVNQIIWIPL